MERKSGYIGKIANAGSQRVEAPAAKQAAAPKGNVRFTGEDLRTGSKSKSKSK